MCEQYNKEKMNHTGVKVSLIVAFIYFFFFIIVLNLIRNSNLDYSF